MILINNALEECLNQMLLRMLGFKIPLGIRMESIPEKYFAFGFAEDAEKLMTVINKRLKDEKSAIDSASAAMREFEPKYTEGEDIDDWFGSYHPMHSPGYITLNSKNLARLLQLILRTLKSNRKRKKLDDLDIAEVISIGVAVVMKTIYHEYFHYFCDILRVTHKNVQPYSLNEEALAVAYSYLMLFSSMRMPFYPPETLHRFMVESNILSLDGKIIENWLDLSTIDKFDPMNTKICIKKLMFDNYPNGYNQYTEYIYDLSFLYDGINEHLFKHKFNVYDGFDGLKLIDSQIRALLFQSIEIRVI
ncbi:hypothetical protein TREPR_1892 [Treponema primitia ZAS-2]|uniref:Uncharacterized protein n=1 Tax=Treponema primitia (strain ATCC BAA-887 / DSM 12427 / ZAS-2) TaxID=545694 RepID=F5YL40_TREPZ|nr:hypothetical protein [Treponema primitia]AEF83744.1 hypothetical protein TREPR_1892 [Treponema primitia ZAS-2]